MIRRLSFGCAAWLVLASAGPTRAAKAEPLPWPLRVSVDYGRPEDGPQGWREEIEGWLISSLEAERCYASVRMADTADLPDRYLRLDIEVTAFEERQLFDVAQSTALDPDQPQEVQQAYTLRAEAAFSVRFAAMPDDLELRRKSFRLIGTHRPTGLDDPRYEVRLQLAQGVLNSVRGMVCGKKLEKEIARCYSRPPP